MAFRGMLAAHSFRSPRCPSSRSTATCPAHTGAVTPHDISIAGYRTVRTRHWRHRLVFNLSTGGPLHVWRASITSTVCMQHARRLVDGIATCMLHDVLKPPLKVCAVKVQQGGSSSTWRPIMSLYTSFMISRSCASSSMPAAYGSATASSLCKARVTHWQRHPWTEMLATVQVPLFAAHC